MKSKSGLYEAELVGNVLYGTDTSDISAAISEG